MGLLVAGIGVPMFKLNLWLGLKVDMVPNGNGMSALVMHRHKGNMDQVKV